MKFFLCIIHILDAIRKSVFLLLGTVTLLLSPIILSVEYGLAPTKALAIFRLITLIILLLMGFFFESMQSLKDNSSIVFGGNALIISAICTFVLHLFVLCPTGDNSFIPYCGIVIFFLGLYSLFLGFLNSIYIKKTQQKNNVLK